MEEEGERKILNAFGVYALRTLYLRRLVMAVKYTPYTKWEVPGSGSYNKRAARFSIR